MGEGGHHTIVSEKVTLNQVFFLFDRSEGNCNLQGPIQSNVNETT